MYLFTTHLSKWFQKLLRVFSCILLIISIGQVRAQEIGPYSGFRIFTGVSAAIGSHKLRFGLNVAATYQYKQFQSNTNLIYWYVYKQIGTGLKTPELQISQGITVGWGPSFQSQDYTRPYTLANYTGFKYAFGYAYTVYIDKIRTSQQTGQLGISMGSFQLITENDLLAKPALDRFRTAAIQVRYQVDPFWTVGVNCILWTGKYGFRQFFQSPNKSSGCYLDTVGGIYTKHSVGWLSLFTGYKAPYANQLQAELGMDAEQVRNIVQNKVMHDMVFLPKRWHNPNCHIPMVDTNGQSYVYLPGQKIRKAKGVWQLQINNPLFY